MHLEFNSLDELREMIAEMGYVRKIDLEIEAAQYGQVNPGRLLNVQVFNANGTYIPTTGATTDEKPDWIRNAIPPANESEQGNAPAPAGELAAGATTGSTENAADTAASEAPKRKRRTKAEMEAARAAEQSNAPAGPSETTEAAAQSPATHGNPFEASTSNPSTATQAILSAPTGQAATLAGIQAMQSSPFETAAVSVGAEQADTSASTTAESAASASKSATQMGNIATDAATFIETRSLEILSTQTEPLTAVKHMHLCRDFIAKHGQAKYLEGFALAGLPATIGTYKPEQCAKHQAALEFLNLNA